MKKFQMAWLGAVAALLSARCTDLPERLLTAGAALLDGGTPPCPVSSPACVPVSPPEALDGGCSDRRWIATVPDPDPRYPCPPVSGASGGAWSAGQLFAEPGSPLPLAPALRPYCAYEWRPASSSPSAPPDLNALHASLDRETDELNQDCHVVAPLGTSLGVEVGWLTLREQLHEQMGRLPHLPLDSSNVPSEVRIAVVDSSATGYSGGLPAEDRSGHGEAVGWLIREQTCIADAGVPSACVGQIANHLALPHLTPTVRDPVQGGYFGYQGELARAIHRAVHDWRVHKLDGGAQPRLVINLSLGWDPVHGGEYGAPADLLPPVRAVLLALEHAACQGALVIAAAGNDPGGPAPVSGPLYPAGWETKAPPTPAACADSEGEGYAPGDQYPVFPPTGSYHPLVYAVGGVRGDDLPLESTRPGGQPRLVAPAAHAVADHGGGPTAVLTGTSAGAAVASAVAATVWGYRPGLSGPEVMELVRRGGTPLGVPADFCLGGGSCPLAGHEIVRVNQCQALQEACDTGEESCPAAALLPGCTARPPGGGTDSRLTTSELIAIHAGATRGVSGRALQWELAPLPVCRHRAVLAANPQYPVDACPARQYHGTPLRPWTGPQPSADPCPSCSLFSMPGTGLWTLQISIDRDFGPLEATVLRLNDSPEDPNDGYDVDLSGLGILSGGDVVEVTELDLSGAGLPLRYATLSFKIDSLAGASSTSSKVLVNP